MYNPSEMFREREDLFLGMLNKHLDRRNNTSSYHIVRQHIRGCVTAIRSIREARAAYAAGLNHARR